MFESIRLDASRYFSIDGWENPSFVGRVFVLFFSYGFHAMVVYRFGKYINVFRAKLFYLPLYWVLTPFYSLFYWLSKKMYGIDICRDAEIGKGFYVGHFGGIKVSRCTIGEFCNIHQLTQIEPDVVIGDFVWIGAHATVAERVCIEDHATVTVAARVDSPVASYCLVAGAPARTIKINFDNSVMMGISTEK